MHNLSNHYPHDGNSSITTSVTIRVTPEHYHLISWGLLWSGFFFAAILLVPRIKYGWIIIGLPLVNVRILNNPQLGRRRSREQCRCHEDLGKNEIYVYYQLFIYLDLRLL
jgi:hypothetical protein